MSDLVARTGRLQQRYEGGCRLVAGCIPFKYRSSDESSSAKSEKIVEVLMINSTRGPGLVFPKGGWENDETVEAAAVREAIEEAGVRGDIMLLRAEISVPQLYLVINAMQFLGYYNFKSKSHRDKFSPEGSCKAAMFALLVNEELESWPEQSTRSRSWLTIPEAVKRCRHLWMREALEEGFCKWHDRPIASPSSSSLDRH
ncbi:hypothetical protein HHK36_017880 [Tetracentron sinense]|uniref:Nudix hydrolase domain-containing protein n=1 Tax=Tetracentron sinense TaxID=13715 RepID=A0A834YYN5_TETSI|nr:hypothetical protein HHK36_017880 [Tetracentron sinense]